MSTLRAVLCVPNPQDYIDQFKNYSIMIINPDSTQERLQYLLDYSDYSLLIDEKGEHHRKGGSYENEKVLWYTSGTTGDSKFYSFSEEKINKIAERICNAYDLTADDRYTNVMGLWHAHGQAFYWASKLKKFEIKFLSLKNIRDISTHSPTFLTAIPGILKLMTKMDFKDLRFIRSASAAMPSELYNTLKYKFRVPVIEAFGMTESGSHCFTNPLYGEQRIGTVGLPNGVEAKIVDNNLYIKGDTVVEDGWFKTMDLAMQDEAGYYKILGRADDRININGYKLDPLSIENMLFEKLPELEECAVFGRDSVKCVYVGPYTKQQVKQVLCSINKHSNPKKLEKLQSIPKNTAGKISRTFLNQFF